MCRKPSAGARCTLPERHRLTADRTPYHAVVDEAHAIGRSVDHSGVRVA